MNWLRKLFTKRSASKTLTPAEKDAFWSSVYNNDSPQDALRKFLDASTKLK
jgi:hypothetical protein